MLPHGMDPGDSLTTEPPKMFLLCCRHCEGPGVEKVLILNQRGDTDIPFLDPLEVSSEAPNEDLCPKPPMKRPGDEGTVLGPGVGTAASSRSARESPGHFLWSHPRGHTPGFSPEAGFSSGDLFSSSFMSDRSPRSCENPTQSCFMFPTTSYDVILCSCEY